MLKGVHFLLTLTCNYECDHCFLYCGPRASGTFTVEQLEEIFRQMDRMPSIDGVYFEGGEAFLYYPLLLHGLKLATERGYRRGIVTNGYWANGEKDVESWLAPLAKIGLDDLSVSDDSLHHGEQEGTRSRWVKNAAERLGLPSGTICLERPSGQGADSGENRGEPIVGGDIRFRGRAADKLTDGLPRRPWRFFDHCPDEDLAAPGRIHLDAFGNVHVCQGICIGNVWKTPLDEIMAAYDCEKHPVCGPLQKGGPAALAEAFDFQPEDGYVDACHLCYRIRQSLLDRFPEELAPRLVYGVE